MNDNPNRTKCSKCGAANFPSSTTCWQCGEPLSVEQQEPSESVATVSSDPPVPASPTYVPPADRKETETLVIVGFVLGGLGFFGCCCCCSPLCSIAAIVLGAMAHSKGDSRGMWVIIVGAASLIIGLLPLIWMPFTMPFKGPWPGPFPGPFPGPWKNT